MAKKATPKEKKINQKQSPIVGKDGISFSGILVKSSVTSVKKAKAHSVDIEILNIKENSPQLAKLCKDPGASMRIIEGLAKNGGDTKLECKEETFLMRYLSNTNTNAPEKRCSSVMVNQLCGKTGKKKSRLVLQITDPCDKGSGAFYVTNHGSEIRVVLEPAQKSLIPEANEENPEEFE